MSQVKKLMKRSEVSIENKWAIEDLYADDSKWQIDFDELKEEYQKLSAYQGELKASSAKLLSFLEFSDELSKKLEKVYVYASQKSHEDMGNSVYQNLSAMAQNLMVQISGASAFAVPEILEIDEKSLEQYYREEAGLEEYRTYIEEIIRQRPHVRSKEVESILADAGEITSGPGDIFSMFQNADLTFPDIEDEDGNLTAVTQGRYITFLESSNPRVRRDAFLAMYQTYGAYKNSLAAMYGANLKKENFYANTRNYPGSLEMHLDGSSIPTEVYHNLINTIHEYLPLMHRYVKLRKKKLGVEELHMYDLYTPMVSQVDMKIPYEEAKDMVTDGLKLLGDDYLNLLKEGFEHRWIDVYENEGKRGGAYSWGAYGTHPYVLLNYQENLNNVFTLAHEMGHALHTYHSNETQPYIYAGYKIFVAEVASTCNESLLMDHLLKNAKTKDERAYLINYFLEQFRGTVFRQTMFAEFELITHKMVKEGKTLTPDVLCDIYYDLNEKYYGEDIVVDKEISMEWARIPHFYTPFYVYQYATGFSAAIAISSKIKNKEENAVENYKQFLSSGSSKTPIELLKICGIDMTKAQPIENALLVFKQYLDEFEKLV